MPMSRHLCQLAYDWTGDVPADGVMIERKWDGFRCLWFTGRDGVARLWTRNGMPIEGCEHITHRMRQIEAAAGEPMFIDGELVVDGTLAATKAWVEGGWRHGGEAGALHAFDAMPEAAWRAGGSDVPLYRRKAALASLIDATAPGGSSWRLGSHGCDDVGPHVLDLVQDAWVFDHADVLDAAHRIWATGGEGLMLKDPIAAYERRRSPAWRKVRRDTKAVLALQDTPLAA